MTHIYDFTFDGKKGSVDLSGRFATFRGPWASHTGYHNATDAEFSFKKPTRSTAKALASKMHAKASALPFIVGAEHRDQGWTDIRKHWDEPFYYVQLPQWTPKPIVETLKSIGFELVCEGNNYWILRDEEATQNDIKDMLSPLLKPGTRLADEYALAQATLTSHKNAALTRSKLQLSLF